MFANHHHANIHLIAQPKLVNIKLYLIFKTILQDNDNKYIIFSIIEIELSSIHQKCHGWICPRNQSCEAIVDEPCKNYDCKIFRTCIEELDDRDDLDNTKNHSKNSESPALHLRNELSQFNAHHDGKKNKIMSTTVITSTEKSLFTDVNPTLSSLSLWMNYLRNETGIEAVKNWVQKAEDANDYAVIQKKCAQL